MVFIEDRNKYLRSLYDQPKQMALLHLLFDLPFQFPAEETSETDTIYYSSIQAIKNSSRDNFNKHYLKISKRKITSNTNAPFIHDDFLMFTLIIGVVKFQTEKEWLLGVINNRVKNSITATFENLLNNNYLSTNSIHSLTLVFLSILDNTKITNEQLIKAYESITNSQQTQNNDFTRIIQYKAFDIVILLKLPTDNDAVSRLFKFESRFKKRVNIFSLLVYNGSLLLFLFTASKALNILPENFKENINNFALILGLAGIGLVANVIPACKTVFQNLMLRVFGYPQ